MISSVMITKALKRTMMMMDSRKPMLSSMRMIMARLLAHRGRGVLHPGHRAGPVRGLLGDELGPGVRDERRHQRDRRHEADEHPDGQQTTHDRVEPDVRQGPERRPAHH